MILEQGTIVLLRWLVVGLRDSYILPFLVRLLVAPLLLAAPRRGRDGGGDRGLEVRLARLLRLPPGERGLTRLNRGCECSCFGKWPQQTGCRRLVSSWARPKEEIELGTQGDGAGERAGCKERGSAKEHHHPHPVSSSF